MLQIAVPGEGDGRRSQSGGGQGILSDKGRSRLVMIFLFLFLPVQIDAEFPVKILQWRITQLDGGDPVLRDLHSQGLVRRILDVVEVGADGGGRHRDCQGPARFRVVTRLSSPAQNESVVVLQDTVGHGQVVVVVVVVEDVDVLMSGWRPEGGGREVAERGQGQGVGGGGRRHGHRVGLVLVLALTDLGRDAVDQVGGRMADVR